MSTGLLTPPLAGVRDPTLIVCGSHTGATSRQLAALEAAGVQPVVIETDEAMRDRSSTAARVAAELSMRLRADGIGVVATERTRRSEHGTLSHGEAIMATVTEVVRRVSDQAGTVIAKGGITSAAVAAAGFGAREAWVRGQLLPGVSLWDLATSAGPMPYVVVPGNVGTDDTLVTLLQMLAAR
jgi:uncharacterized protein YgbK (DUF1537 family)